ncbi:Os02g0624700, partial [Oryza sativa Japonica Group]
MLHYKPRTYLEQLPRVLGHPVGDEHHEVAAGVRVADGLAEDPHAEDELVPVQQRHVRLVLGRRRRRPATGRQHGRRDEERGPEPYPRRRPPPPPHR